MRLQIPSLSIDAAVEELGMERDGRTMAMPKQPTSLGWYNSTLSAPYFLGNRPGDVGNSVWAGYEGTAFYKLPNIETGTDVFVATASGGRMRYRVTSRTTYSAETINMGSLIDPKARPAEKEWLTLITSDKLLPHTDTTLSYLVVVAERVD